MFNPYVRIRLGLRARRFRRKGDPELRLLPSLAARGKRSIDIGANRGVYTYWLARCSGCVEAFEPNPDLAGRLAQAGLRNVSVHAAALSDRAGTAALFIPRHRKGGLDDPGARLQAADPGEGVECPVRIARLDDYGFSEVGFIKIDVEGHEESVIDGAWETIAANRPKLLVELEERHNPGCLGRTRDRLAALGYRCRYVDGGAWHDADTLADGQRAASGRYINNFLFTPEG